MLLSGKGPPLSTWEALVREAALVGALFGGEGELSPGGLSSLSWEADVDVEGELNM